MRAECEEQEALWRRDNEAKNGVIKVLNQQLQLQIGKQEHGEEVLTQLKQQEKVSMARELVEMKETCISLRAEVASLRAAAEGDESAQAILELQKQHSSMLTALTEEKEKAAGLRQELKVLKRLL